MLLGLLALALAAPAQADVHLYDVPAGTVRTIEGELDSWTRDGTGLLVSRDGVFGRVDLGTGTFGPAPEPRFLAGPLGHWLETGFKRAALHAPDGRVLATFRQASGLHDPPGVAWTRDGGRLALTTSYGLWVVDTATGRTLVRDKRETYLTEQAWAPDGTAIAVTQGRRVVRLDVPSGRRTGIFTARELLPFGAWSASGRLAITTDDRIVVPGSPSLRVAVPPLDSALWSGDGSTLRFRWLRPPDGCSIPETGLAVAVPGAEPRLLVEPGTRDIGAAHWSPTAPVLAADLGPEAAEPTEPARGERKPWPGRIARDYAMGSRRGNAAMRRIVVRAARALRRGEGREAVLARVRVDFARVADRFPEAADTASREPLADELDKWLDAAGYEVIEAYDEIDC